MRAKVLLWIVTLAILAVPRTSHAGLIDVILEMSGPQLLGFGLQCDIALDDGATPQCMLFGKRLGWETRRSGRVWVDFLAAAYFSTGRDGEEDGLQIRFSGGRARMIGFDPMISLRWNPNSTSSHRWYSGVGLLLNRFFGPDIDAFNNWALKLRPVGWDWDRPVPFLGLNLKLDAAYNLRLYPNGFDATPTGGLSSTSELEAVHGFLVGVSF